MILLFLGLIAGLFTWWKISQNDEPAETETPTEDSLIVQPAVDLPEGSSADPSQTTVIISTFPTDGAEVTINEEPVEGRTPLSVPLPTGSTNIEVCVRIDEWECRLVPFEVLAAEPRYIFELQSDPE